MTLLTSRLMDHVEERKRLSDPDVVDDFQGNSILYTHQGRRTDELIETGIALEGWGNFGTPGLAGRYGVLGPLEG